MQYKYRFQRMITGLGVTVLGGGCIAAAFATSISPIERTISLVLGILQVATCVVAFVIFHPFRFAFDANGVTNQDWRGTAHIPFHEFSRIEWCGEGQEGTVLIEGAGKQVGLDLAQLPGPMRGKLIALLRERCDDARHEGWDIYQHWLAVIRPYKQARFALVGSWIIVIVQLLGLRFGLSTIRDAGMNQGLWIVLIYALSLVPFGYLAIWNTRRFVRARTTMKLADPPKAG